LIVLATVDSQFIALTDHHLCLQHDARQAARRAGPSATADTCVMDAMFRRRLRVTLLFLSLLLLLVFGMTTCMSAIPADDVVVVNSSTVFDCSSNRSVVWSFRRTGQRSDERVYVDGQPSERRYSVNRSADDQYALMISDVQLTDAGLYTCIDNDGFGPAASARLVVLDSLPTCGVNVFEPVVESQRVQLRCTFVYAGSPPPHVRWASPRTGDVLTDLVTSSSRRGGELTAVESRIIVTAAAGTVGPFRFTVTTFDDEDDDGGTPTFVWISPSFDVLYAARDVVIDVPSDQDVVAVGEVVRCRADGFPPPRYEWTDVASGWTSSGPELRLDAAGRRTYQCTATNVLANATYSAGARLSLLVTATRPPSAPGTTSVTAAVVIAAVSTSVVAALIVSCAILARKLSIINRRQPSSTGLAAAVVLPRQVRVCPPPVAVPAADGGSKRDAASCLYDSIDERDAGYEPLPSTGRASAAEQAAAAGASTSPSPVDSPDTLQRPLCCHTAGHGHMDAVQPSPHRTPVANDENDTETVRRDQAQCSDTSVRYVQPQQHQPQHQSCEQYANAVLASAPVSAATFDDDGVYIHTL